MLGQAGLLGGKKIEILRTRPTRPSGLRPGWVTGRPILLVTDDQLRALNADPMPGLGSVLHLCESLPRVEPRLRASVSEYVGLASVCGLVLNASMEPRVELGAQVRQRRRRMRISGMRRGPAELQSRVYTRERARYRIRVRIRKDPDPNRTERGAGADSGTNAPVVPANI